MDSKCIVREIDDAIINGMEMTDDLMELSLSENLDDYEFEKMICKFVYLPFNDQDVLSAIQTSLNRYIKFGEYDFIRGLSKLRYLYEANQEVINLYYHLDHYIIEEKEWHTKSEIDKFIREWIGKNIKTAQQGVAPEPVMSLKRKIDP